MATLDVPCFRYLGNDLTAPLIVENTTGAEHLVSARLGSDFFRLTPESAFAKL